VSNKFDIFYNLFIRVKIILKNNQFTNKFFVNLHTILKNNITMAIIGTIRKRSGLLLILIGVAIAGFVLQDALKSTKGFKYKEIGKVNKTDVTYAEFERKVEQQLENIKYMEYNGKRYSDEKRI